jgi:hypothetical protein
VELILDSVRGPQPGRPSRWRPAGRGATREVWNGPSSSASDRPTSNISKYGSPDYVLGETEIPFAVTELPDQPVEAQQTETDGRDSRRQKNPTDRASIPVRSLPSINGPSILEPEAGFQSHRETAHGESYRRNVQARRQSDSILGTTTSRRSNRPSTSSGPGGPNRAVSAEEQMKTRQIKASASSNVPNEPRTDTRRAPLDSRGRNRARSPNNLDRSPELAPNLASTPQADRARKESNSDRHHSTTTSTSASHHRLQPQSINRESREGKHDWDRVWDRDRRQQPNPPMTRQHRNSSLRRNDRRGSEEDVPPNARQASRHSFRHRYSSRSTSRH